MRSGGQLPAGEGADAGRHPAYGPKPAGCDVPSRSGPQADIGPISFNGLKDMNEAFVRKRLLIHQGERFSPQAVETARADLSLDRPILGGQGADAGSALDPQGQLPMTFDLTERPLHAVDVGIGYSTDLGANLNVGWHDRNLFGNARTAEPDGVLPPAVMPCPARLPGRRAVPEAGFSAPRPARSKLDLMPSKQSLQAYEQTALLEKIALNRKLRRTGPSALVCPANRSRSSRRASPVTTTSSAPGVA